MSETSHLTLTQQMWDTLKDNEGLTDLQLAVGDNHFYTVDFLLKEGADIEAKDANGFTSFDWAVCLGHKKIVRLLLQHGATLSQALIHNLKFTPEIFSSDILKSILYERSATLPSSAIESVLRTLTSKDSACDINYYLALFCKAAESAEIIQMVTRVLRIQPQLITAQDEHGRTIMHRLANYLLEVQAQLQKVTQEETKLYLTVSKVNLNAMMCYLINLGVNIDQSDQAGNTARSLLARLESVNHDEVSNSAYSANRLSLMSPLLRR